MMTLPTEIPSAKKLRLHRLLLAGGIVALFAYAATYLLTVSPIVVRAIGTVLGGS